MKTVVIFALIAIVMSCKSGGKESRLTSQKLNGVWFVRNVNKSNKSLDEFTSLNSDRMNKDNHFLNFFYFDGTNNFQCDTGSINLIKGNYKIEDSVLTINGKEGYNKNLFFTAMQSEDSTKMRLYTDYDEDSNNKLVYEIIKIKDNDIVNNDWKTPLPAAATDAEIRAKLEKAMKYYRAYFSTLGTNDVQLFSQRKVCVPIKLYSGGMGTQSVEETRDFEKLMGSKENATKGLEMLRKCFKADFDYNKRANFLLEYADAFAFLAKQVR